MRIKSCKKIIKNYWLILLLLLVFHAINNYTILFLDNTFPTYDEWDNLKASFDIYRDFRTLNLSNMYSWYSNLGDTGYRPPLYHILLSLTHNISKNINADCSIVMANMLYFGILLISVFGIGRMLGSAQAGLLAAFIVSIFPGVFAMSRVLMVDFPLSAMLSLSIYLMLMTEYFVNTKYSFLFGLSVGLGMLTKVPYVIFILPVLGYYSIASIIKASKNNRKFSALSRNLAFFLFATLFVSATWYIPNLDKVIQRSKAMSFPIKFSPLGGKFIDYYISSLFSYHIGAFFFIVGLIFLFYCLKKKKGALLFIWIFAPLFIFSFSSNRNPRFILPLLPAIGLIIACGVFLIKKAIIRRIACGFIITFGLYSYFAISYGKHKLLLEKAAPYPIYCHLRINHGILSPLRVDWKVEEAGDIILSSIQQENSTNPIKIIFLPNIGEIHCAIKYYLTTKNKKAIILCPAQGDVFESLNPDDFPGITSFDFVINKNGDMGNPNPNLDWFTILRDAFEKDKDSFYLVGSVKGLPDGSNLDIFKKK